MGSDLGDRDTPHSYTEQFYEMFPYYMAIGMTADEYWNGDPTLPRYYRKADELRRERVNEELWWQGMYIYEAIGDIAPVLNPFAKKGTKVQPYREKPYPVTKRQLEAYRIDEEKKKAEKARRFMEALMAETNARFRKEVDGDGRD